MAAAAHRLVADVEYGVEAMSPNRGRWSMFNWLQVLTLSAVFYKTKKKKLIERRKGFVYPLRVELNQLAAVPGLNV